MMPLGIQQPAAGQIQVGDNALVIEGQIPAGGKLVKIEIFLVEV